MKKRRPGPGGVPGAGSDKVRCTCPCGAALKIPRSRVDQSDKCPRCRRRLLLTGKTDEQGRLVIHPLVLEERERKSPVFKIEDHFREVELPKKIPFFCPCGKKMVARPEMVDRRGRCARCGMRLLLVGKLNPETHQVEIHPLSIEAPGTGDTFLIEG